MRLLVLLVAVSVCHLACVSAWSSQEQDLIAATATTDVEPSFMEVANIKYPREQKICCNLGSDTEKKFCRDQRTLPANMTYWSLCVGATGFECLGVEKMINIFKVIKLPVTIVKMWPYDSKRFSPHGVVKPQPEKNMVGLFASVGAIMHDRCCTVHNDGAFCNDKNNPILATVNVNFGKYDNNCACLLEWRRAVFDLFHQYGERMNFPKTPQMNRNTVHKDKSRKSTLPGKLTVLNGLMGSDWTKFYDQDIAETEGTLAITFSPGSKLLCVAAADPHCKVPEKVACNKATKATDKKCKAELKPAQETAGDASYCRSKKFKKVVYKTDNVGYGICA